MMELLHTHLSCGKEKSVTAQQSLDWSQLIEQAQSEPQADHYLRQKNQNFHDYEASLSGTVFLSLFETYIKLYGHRGVYESDISTPRYWEEPEKLLSQIHFSLLNVNHIQNRRNLIPLIYRSKRIGQTSHR